jgi:hypothetical protein
MSLEKFVIGIAKEELRAAQAVLVQRAAKAHNAEQAPPGYAEAIAKSAQQLGAVDPSTIRSLLYIALVETSNGYAVETGAHGCVETLHALTEIVRNDIAFEQLQLQLSSVSTPEAESPAGTAADTLIGALRASGLNVHVIGF